jgi:hypothetical protein
VPPQSADIQYVVMMQLLESGLFEANPVVVGLVLAAVVAATLVFFIRQLRR